MQALHRSLLELITLIDVWFFSKHMQPLNCKCVVPRLCSLTLKTGVAIAIDQCASAAAAEL